MLDIGNGGFLDFRVASGNHFQPHNAARWVKPILKMTRPAGSLRV
jgi:hypothetical protein